MIDPTGMAGEAIDNEYTRYVKDGVVQKVVQTGTEGGDLFDRITDVDMDRPMEAGSVSVVSVEKSESRVSTNLSFKDGSSAGTIREPGFRHDYKYKAQNQGIEPMDLDSPFFAVGLALKGCRSTGSSINLAISSRTAHIIAGDATGGGHAWFGSLKSFGNGLSKQKSMFPASWSNSKIMHAVSDVAVNNPWVQQTGKAGAMFTKSGQPVRYMIEGSYVGVRMRVITTSNDIITAFPIK